MKMHDLSGRRFGRLTAIAFQSVASTGRKRIFWQCQCDCGGTASVITSSLLVGYTKSCGCLQREAATEKGIKHGESHTRRYKTWAGIIQRCTNPRNQAFRNYGGRGITVCEKWRTYEGFAEDVPPAPEGDFSLDRIDNDKGYEPGNVRWATPKMQRSNQRPSHDGAKAFTPSRQRRRPVYPRNHRSRARPSPALSLDRIDNERGYEPNNLRWATRKEQSNNRRPRRRVGK